MNDQIRAAIIAFLQSVFPLAVLFGAPVTETQVAATMLVVNNGLTLVMLFWKKGQEHESANPP
jgi:hypothetical protein